MQTNPMNETIYVKEEEEKKDTRENTDDVLDTIQSVWLSPVVWMPKQLWKIAEKLCHHVCIQCKKCSLVFVAFLIEN